MELVAEVQRMVETQRVQCEREQKSEERDDNDPEHSSGHDRDLETTSSSDSVVVQGLSGLNEHS